jgi:hypothetical protein
MSAFGSKADLGFERGPFADAAAFYEAVIADVPVIGENSKKPPPG